MSQTSKAQHSHPPVYEPTPEQIQAACREIQREWTPAERRRRNVVGSTHGSIANLFNEPEEKKDLPEESEEDEEDVA
jgi:hypothetical protein